MLLFRRQGDRQLFEIQKAASPRKSCLSPFHYCGEQELGYLTAEARVMRKNPFMVRQAHHERDGAM